MPKFTVRVREFFDYEVEVEANTKQEAIQQGYAEIYDYTGMPKNEYYTGGDGEIAAMELNCEGEVINA